MYSRTLIRLFCIIVASTYWSNGLPLISDSPPTYVVKRDGRKQPVSFDKITKRVRNLCSGLNEKFVDPVVVAQGVVRGLFSGVSTSELDNLASETAAYMSTDHPDYALLASRIAISNLQKDTPRLFSEVVEKLYRYVDPKSGLPAGFISDKLYEKVMKHADEINAYIDHSRDFNFDYFGFKTLEKSYLLKVDNKVVERPQYLFMRVALGIHLEDDDLKAAFETYDLMSEKWFIHASPTLFHAGTKCPQMSSCFLLGMQSDSIEGIYDTLSQCALISKAAGGIGLSVHNIRAKGSYIKGTKGTSNGLVPMLRVFDATARYVDQGGGKRPGAFAIYLEPWHADIFEVLELRKNTGKEEARARDLFYGLWVPDLFMKRVEEDGEWSLMCPAECPGLADCWGEEFEELYESYVKRGKARKTIRARELWYAILDAQMETGTPYMLYKDACNKKSNQQNLGTIKCSNLCTEIVEYTAPDEIAVCNLASIVLSKFVRPWNLPAKRARMFTNLGVHKKKLSASGKQVADNSDSGTDDDVPGWKDPVENDANDNSKLQKGFNELPVHAELYNVRAKPGCESADTPATSAGYLFDHKRLYEVTKVITRNLNKIIDLNFYPVPEARKSNMRHRPIGIGVQGLADAFQCMKLPFDSADAKRLNRDIFETIYFASLEASCELAEKYGPYESYSGSPASKGVLQHDMWGVKATDRWDWEGLRARIAKHGLRNSLLLAPMPTASTAQILGNNECIEPYTSNMYVRRVRAGEFIVVNPHLLDDLVERGLWTPEIRNHIMANGGSIQNIPEIDKDLKEIYRTVWEIKQRSLIDMAADRGAFIDQSQSLNVFIASPDYSKLTSLHFHSWRRGLKTGMYYLRTKPAAQAIQFTVDQSGKKSGSGGTRGSGASTPIYGEACTSCSG